MKQFLLFCSGANTEVLKQCPTEESKYVGIGATILLTALMASLSGGYALFTVFRSIPVALVFGLVWGVVIFNLDRVIVSGMRKQKYVVMDVMYALPRVGLSILLAIVISRPLELRLFEAEIREEWTVAKARERLADEELFASSDAAQIQALTRENTRLREDLARQEEAVASIQASLLQEMDGTGGTGVRGIGTVSQAKQAALDSARVSLAQKQVRNDSLIARNEQQIAALRSEADSLVNQTTAVRNESLGFLARMKTFGILKADNPTIHWASLFITLLFISLETAPVMVKLLATLSPYRPYDELLEQREFEIVEAVRQNVKVKRHALKADAERVISDQSGMMETEMHLSTERNQQRLSAELQANEALMQRIADAQVQLAGVLVDEWKANEMEKILKGRTRYTSRMS